jgi:hypothetical protein
MDLTAAQAIGISVAVVIATIASSEILQRCTRRKLRTWDIDCNSERAKRADDEFHALSCAHPSGIHAPISLSNCPGWHEAECRHCSEYERCKAEVGPIGGGA